MKLCCRCKIEKDETLFIKRKAMKDGLLSFCKECQKKRFNKWYTKSENIESIQKSHKKRMRLSINANYEKVLQYYRSHPCIDCGESRLPCLDFDHIRGKKRFTIANVIRKGYCWKTIQEEIDKCVVRCANCHRMKTAKEQNWYKYEQGITT